MKKADKEDEAKEDFNPLSPLDYEFEWLYFINNQRLFKYKQIYLGFEESNNHY